MKEIEISDKRTVDEAVQEGLRVLGVSEDRAVVEVLSAGGLFSKPRVKVSVKEGAGDTALQFVEGLLKAMGHTVSTSISEENNEVNIELAGEDSGSIIGYRGEVLDAIQYLASVVANADDKNNYTRVTVNTEGYRERRSETLNALADRMADKAVATGRRVPLEAMNPCDRRTVHLRLQENPEVTAHSEGEEPYRRIIIVPKGEKRPPNKGRSNNNNNKKGGGFAKSSSGDRNNNNRNNRNNNRGRNVNLGERSSGFTEGYYSNSGFTEDLSGGKNYTTSKKYNK